MLGDAKGDVVWVMTCCYDYDLIMTMAVGLVSLRKRI
jgi:hypothetical protein